MGLISSLGEKVRLDNVTGFKVAADIAEGVFDGALLVAGPPGWAILGAKTTAWAAVDADVDMLEAFGRTGLGIGLGVAGGKAVGALTSKAAAAGIGSGAGAAASRLSESIPGAVLNKGRQAGALFQTVEGQITGAARFLASQTDDVLSRSSVWSNAVSPTGALGRAQASFEGFRDEGGSQSFAWMRRLIETKGGRFRAAEGSHVSNMFHNITGQQQRSRGESTTTPVPAPAATSTTP